MKKITRNIAVLTAALILLIPAGASARRYACVPDIIKEFAGTVCADPDRGDGEGILSLIGLRGSCALDPIIKRNAELLAADGKGAAAQRLRELVEGFISENVKNGGTPAEDAVCPDGGCDTANAPDEENGEGAQIGVSEYERSVVTLVNGIREKNGLGALALNEELCRLARMKSCDMSANSYFSHESPTYGSAFDMMRAAGLKYRAAGENIAKGYATPEAVVNAWMNSEGHRANILNAAFREIGVGLCGADNCWTQMFIG